MINIKDKRLSIPDIITTNEALWQLKEYAETKGYIALDTEFVSERTYYPQLGLIQAGFSIEECYLIDVLAVSSLNTLGEILSDSRIVKILHDSQQDLTILRRATGAFPKNIFDTQHAAGFAGVRSTISLCELISTVCGITLSKTETRTNWLQRPLSAAQIDYALDDVRYLPKVREKLLLQIGESERDAWLQEDLDDYNSPELYKERDPYEQFNQVKGSGRLVNLELAALRELTAWREKEARRRDRPRSWIIPDAALIQLARKQPRSINALKMMKDIFERHVHRYGDSMLQAIEKSTMMKEADYPEPGNQRKENGSFKTLIDFGLSIIKGKSKGYGIDPGLLATRSEIKALVHEGMKATSKEHRILRGWRKKMFGEQLRLLLSA